LAGKWKRPLTYIYSTIGPIELATAGIANYYRVTGNIDLQVVYITSCVAMQASVFPSRHGFRLFLKTVYKFAVLRSVSVSVDMSYVSVVDSKSSNRYSNQRLADSEATC